MWEDRPGRPLQLQEILDRHLCQGVAGVELHDESNHDGDQHDDRGGSIVVVVTEQQQSTLRPGVHSTTDLGAATEDTDTSLQPGAASSVPASDWTLWARYGFVLVVGGGYETSLETRNVLGSVQWKQKTLDFDTWVEVI